MTPGWAILLMTPLLAALAQEPGPVVSADEAREQRVRATIEEIESIAASEPPVVGIDTQIRAAEVLLKGRPAEAAVFLRDAASRILSLAHRPTRAALLLDYLRIQMALDRGEAESMMRAVLADWPAREAEAADAEALRRLARWTKDMLPDLSEEAARKAEQIVPREQPVRKKDKPGKGVFGRGVSIPEDVDAEGRVSYARRLKDPYEALTVLLDVIDAKGLTERRRATLASEALDLTAKIEPGDDRLLAQSMLTRRLYEAGDRPRAAVAAQMLAETFEKMYDCETAACDQLRGGENPGEIINAFAEYLYQHSIAPESLGLRHNSLHVRLLLLELYELVHGVRRKV